MLKNYLKIAFRNFRRHRAWSFINVLGLAIGLAVCMVILLHIRDEMSFDNFHENGDRIYRVNRNWRQAEHEKNYAANAPAAISPNLKAEFPAVEQFTRVAFAFPQNVLISHGEKRFYEEGFYWADSTFFEVFSFKLKAGDPKTALTEINSIVLTERMARKYFGDENPIGKILTIATWSTDDYKITGVLADVPENSHLQFDFLGSVRGADQRYDFVYSGEGQWTNSLVYNYVLLREGASAAALEDQMVQFSQKHLGEFAQERGFIPEFWLQPLGDIYLQAGVYFPPGPTSDATYVYIFAAIATLILTIACINYMNLATARSTHRGREVGMRKVLGAQRRALIRQFIGESLIIAFMALLLALMLVELILPIFNSLAGKTLSFDYAAHPEMLALFAGVAALVGVFSGSYPAFSLSAFKPVSTLKGEVKSGRKGLALRKVLITTQFVASIVLIVATAVVAKQMNFMQSQPLGFDKEQIAILPLRDGAIRNQIETVKQEILKIPNVRHVTAAAGVPGKRLLVDDFPVLPSGVDRSAQIQMQIAGVDYDYFETLGIELASGRNFQREMRTDSAAAFVINESAAQAFGWDDPLGKRIELIMNNGKKGMIVGVVKDFHFRSLHEKIQPAVFHIWPNRYACIAVKMQTDNAPETVAGLQSIWARLAPDQPFEFSFLDTEFDEKYRKDERVGQIFGYAAGLAIFVACLGLFGLAAFAAERRIKEIGLRKTLGATVPSIVHLLSKDFVKLVILANVIAWPIAWFIMRAWLNDFAYRTEIGWLVFALAGGLALFIAVLTVSTQAIRAAVANPVQSLRYE